MFRRIELERLIKEKETIVQSNKEVLLLLLLLLLLVIIIIHVIIIVVSSCQTNGTRETVRRGKGSVRTEGDRGKKKRMELQ